MKEITLLDALERATSENITVTFRKYDFGTNLIIITDRASGEVWHKRYIWGSELSAALCIMDALEQRKKK